MSTPVTSNRVKSNRKRPWRWVLLAALTSWNCVGVERHTTLTVGGDVGYASPEYISRGCSSEVSRRQSHRQFSAGAHLRYEHESGGLAKANVRAVLGQQLTDSGSEARPAAELPRDYQFVAAGAAGGFDGRYVGADLGASLITNGNEIDYLPYSQLRVGNLDSVWFAGTFGTLDPALYTRLLSAGVSGRTERLRFGAALALSSMWVEVDEDAGLSFASGSEDLMAGVEFDLHVRPTEGSPVAIDLTTFLAEHPAVRLGLSYQFKGL